MFGVFKNDRLDVEKSERTKLRNREQNWRDMPEIEHNREYKRIVERDKSDCAGVQIKNTRLQQHHYGS